MLELQVALIHPHFLATPHVRPVIRVMGDFNLNPAAKVAVTIRLSDMVSAAMSKNMRSEWKVYNRICDTDAHGYVWLERVLEDSDEAVATDEEGMKVLSVVCELYQSMTLKQESTWPPVILTSPPKGFPNGRGIPPMSSDTFYKMPSDLQALIDELNQAERLRQIPTHVADVILVPLAGPCGKAAQLLRDFDMHRWLAVEDLAKAKREIVRLRVLLGHMPGLNEPVEIAYKGDLEVRLVGKDSTSAESTVEWKPSRVDILWSVGVHDSPGFSIKGSTFIHTPESFNSTWRFPLK